jgi:hypothetical protein
MPLGCGNLRILTVALDIVYCAGKERGRLNLFGTPFGTAKTIFRRVVHSTCDSQSLLKVEV